MDFLPRQSASHPHLLAVEPQPDREWNPKHDGQSGEERVAASVAEGIKHLFTEEWKGETHDGARDLEI